MTLSEAQEALSMGCKISHHYFSPDEFITTDSLKRLIDENGTILNWHFFWQLRQNKHWQDGWKIFIPNT